MWGSSFIRQLYNRKAGKRLVLVFLTASGLQCRNMDLILLLPSCLPESLELLYAQFPRLQRTVSSYTKYQARCTIAGDIQNPGMVA